MIVERIWTGNAYRNFNYLIACPETGEALAIDPLDHGKCLAGGQEERLAHHADPQHPRAPRPHRRQRRGGGGHRRQADRAPPRRRQDCGCRSRREGRRRDQGRQDGRARVHGHAGPHDVPHLPALAHRSAGAVLRRHAVQRRRRQLPQRRRPGRAVRRPSPSSSTRCPTTRGSTRGTTTSRTTCSFTLRASPTTRPRRRCCRR